MKTVQIWVGVVVAVLLVVVLYHLGGGASTGLQHPARVITGPVHHPADVVRFKGKYVATELYDNRLAISDTLAFSKPSYFDPKSIGKAFQAPHYMAVTAEGTLLITNGWGSSVVAISDLKGGGWKAFHGIGKRFWAPHGICVDQDGWIYVGDSLNSRLVRFRDMNGKDWQVFKDVDKRISYIRQLRCTRDGVWVSNSYENREGLNPGEGGNVLHITDFTSGRAREVFHIRNANLTALAPMGDGRLLVGLWGPYRQLAVVDPLTQQVDRLGRSALGVPYGVYVDPASGAYLVSYLGSLNDAGGGNPGGIAVYR
jgi:DNA-binding beta-propeller fold protein YncE